MITLYVSVTNTNTKTMHWSAYFSQFRNNIKHYLLTEAPKDAKSFSM